MEYREKCSLFEISFNKYLICLHLFSPFKKVVCYNSQILPEVSCLYLSFSNASLALEISSLINTSFSEYNDLATIFKSCLVSAWNSYFLAGPTDFSLDFSTGFSGSGSSLVTARLNIGVV